MFVISYFLEVLHVKCMSTAVKIKIASRVWVQQNSTPYEGISENRYLIELSDFSLTIHFIPISLHTLYFSRILEQWDRKGAKPRKSVEYPHLWWSNSVTKLALKINRISPSIAKYTVLRLVSVCKVIPALYSEPLWRSTRACTMQHV
jgi:hypothetical protein